MRAIGLSFAIVAAFAACSSKPKPVETTPAEPGSAEPAPTEPAPTEPAPPAGEAMTEERCKERGGTVRHDIGDGKIQCQPGERELGRVATGIEGGVCCAPAVK